jgi:hypothetical protein
MKKSFLGYNPLLISHLGLGCMGMSECYGPKHKKRSLIKRLKNFREKEVLPYINQRIPPDFVQGDLLLEFFARFSSH